MKSLVKLDISFNQIKKVENIGHLKNLKILNLSNNKINNLSRSICGNTALEELNLSSNEI